MRCGMTILYENQSSLKRTCAAVYGYTPRDAGRPEIEPVSTVDNVDFSLWKE